MTQTFHDALVAELNDKHTDAAIKWFNSSWHNDACGSAMFEIDNMKETYIQLHAFETEEDARAEGLVQYSFSISFMGDIDYAAYEGDDRDQCIKEAIAAADRFFEKHHRVTRTYVPLSDFEDVEGLGDNIEAVHTYTHSWERINYVTPWDNWFIVIVRDSDAEEYGGKYHLYLPQEDHISNDLSELETKLIRWARAEGHTMPDSF